MTCPGIIGLDALLMQTVWSPADFQQACARIVDEQHGHAAHRSLDVLTNSVLRSLGYGDGIAIFEAAVAHWHSAAHPYPYSQRCPDCEQAREVRTS